MVDDQQQPVSSVAGTSLAPLLSPADTTLSDSNRPVNLDNRPETTISADSTPHPADSTSRQQKPEASDESQSTDIISSPADLSAEVPSGSRQVDSVSQPLSDQSAGNVTVSPVSTPSANLATDINEPISSSPADPSSETLAKGGSFAEDGFTQ